MFIVINTQNAEIYIFNFNRINGGMIKCFKFKEHTVFCELDSSERDTGQTFMKGTRHGRF